MNGWLVPTKYEALCLGISGLGYAAALRAEGVVRSWGTGKGGLKPHFGKALLHTCVSFWREGPCP